MKHVRKPHKARREHKKRKFFDPRYVHVERRQSLILACILFWSILSFLFIRFFFLATVVVKGDSMIPTLRDGETYVIHRWVYFVKEPQREEIVVIRHPAETTLDVKRIVALPNESIRIRNGSVYVNGERLKEAYLPSDVLTSPFGLGSDEYLINDEHYFVLGDNRRDSHDSRFFGAVSKEDILGRVNKQQP